MSLKIEIPEANRRTEESFPPFQIKIVPTPKELAPLVDELMKIRAFIPLHLHALPQGHEERVMELLQQYPNTPLSPYMSYAAYGSLIDRYNLHPDDKTLSDRLLYYLQNATRSPSQFQIEGLTSQLSIFDQFGLAIPAAETARLILKVMPRDMVGLMGNNTLVKKYLINTKELEPEKYWFVMN